MSSYRYSRFDDLTGCPPARPAGPPTPTAAEWGRLVAANPITLTLDLGPGQLSPVFVTLVPEITPIGLCRLVGAITVPYQVRPGVRPVIKGRVVFDFPGSIKWERQ